MNVKSAWAVTALLLGLLAVAGCCAVGLLQSLDTGKGQFANQKCPILGKPIDPKTPESLTRTHEGKVIAFCCSQCVAEWDKLNREERASRLEHQGHQGDSQHQHSGC